MILKGFPLAHEVSDLPHEPLMFIDDLFGLVAVLVKPRRTHRGLELLYLGLAISDSRLELGNTLTERLGRFLLLSALGLVLLARFAGVFSLWALVSSLWRSRVFGL